MVEGVVGSSGNDKQDEKVVDMKSRDAFGDSGPNDSLYSRY